MKKLLFIVVCCMCLVGCNKENHQNNDIPANNNNKLPVLSDYPKAEETVNSIVNQLNSKLQLSESIQTFKYKELTIDKNDNEIEISCETEDGTLFEITFDSEQNLEEISIEAPPNKTGLGFIVTKDYINTKLFMLKINELNLTKQEYDELVKCVYGIEFKYCVADNKIATEDNEATAYRARFSLSM